LFESFKSELIINSLSAQLLEYSVFYSGSTKETNNITIKKVIDERIILENANRFIIAIHRYRVLADKLITQLAKKYNYSPENITEYWRLELEKTNGKLEKKWEYMFHGKGCFFKNLVTGQIIDTHLCDYRNGLAIPDPYFFSQYIRTTNEEVKILDLIKDDFHDFHDMSRVFKILSKHKYLP